MDSLAVRAEDPVCAGSQVNLRPFAVHRTPQPFPVALVIIFALVSTAAAPTDEASGRMYIYKDLAILDRHPVNGNALEAKKIFDYTFKRYPNYPVFCFFSSKNF